MASVVVRSGSGAGRSREIGAGVTIGRDAASDFPIDDPLVSRQHLRVTARAGGYVVEDLGSSNGTYLNGQRITRGDWRPGDELRVGDTLLALEGLGESAIGPVTLTERRAPIQATLSEIHRRAADERATVADLRERLNLFHRVSEALVRAVSLDDVLQTMLKAFFEVFEQAQRGFVILVNDADGGIEVRARHFRGAGEGEVSLSRTIIEHVLSRNEAVLSHDAAQDERFAGAVSVVQHSIRSMICAPLAYGDEVLGAIYIDTTDARRPFAVTELETLVTLAAQAALLIHHARLVEAHVKGERLAAIGQTVAGLAHCIKNILNGIQGGSYILDRALEKGDAERLAGGWAMVKRNSAFMSDLVLDMLSYARERRPVYEPVDPRTLLQAVRDLVGVRTGDRAVEVTLEVAPGLTTVTVDPTAMKRCLLNLAVNAVEACPKEGGRVVLGCQPGAATGSVRFTVTDNGCGIAPESLAKLFTIFFSTKGSKGTGLGLAVCQKIVQEHGGAIHVRSTVGEGTEFIIDLPADAGAAPGE